MLRGLLGPAEPSSSSSQRLRLRLRRRLRLRLRRRLRLRLLGSRALDATVGRTAPRVWCSKPAHVLAIRCTTRLVVFPRFQRGGCDRAVTVL